MNEPVQPLGLSVLRGEVERLLPDYLRDLEHLVSIDSGSYSKAGVDEVIDWMGQRLEGMGASVARHPDEELGDTLVATFAGRGPGPTVLLIGHADTVFEAGTAAARPLSISDGIVRGPGAGDMKSGLLLGLYALSALRSTAADEGGWLPVGRLLYVVNPDEEIGSPVSTPIIRELAAEADVALVLEGARANGDIVSARKGMMHFRATLRGRSAHAGVEPEKGRSAVLEAAHKTLALHALNDRWDGVTVNVGAIDGGTRPNIVADSAVMQIDMRARSLVDQEAAEAEIRDILESSTVPDIETTVELTAHHKPMEKSAASARIIEQAASLSAELGFVLGDTATGGGSDANTTAGAGVPSLDGLGPVGGNDHTPDEYIELSSIVPRTTLLAALLQNIGRDRGPAR